MLIYPHIATKPILFNISLHVSLTRKSSVMPDEDYNKDDPTLLTM